MTIEIYVFKYGGILGIFNVTLEILPFHEKRCGTKLTENNKNEDIAN
jgi:hypothetical protein